MSKESIKIFNLYSDNTMKSMTKDELIKYVHIIYENWENCDETYEKLVEALSKQNNLLNHENGVLDEELMQKCKLNEQNCKALDKICEILSDCAKMQCDRCPKYKEQGKYLCDICYYDTLNKDQWKEWAMECD